MEPSTVVGFHVVCCPSPYFLLYSSIHPPPYLIFSIVLSALPSYNTVLYFSYLRRSPPLASSFINYATAVVICIKTHISKA